MKSVAKYRRLAEEYRKQALQLMARAWDTVAAERKDRLIGQAVRELLDRICQETVV
jgi:plasmid stabilization system protein ParE